MGLLSRIKTWVEGDTLTAADLNAEFNNITGNVSYPQIKYLSDYARFSVAITSIGSTPSTLVLDVPGTVSEDTTIPSTLHIVCTKKGVLTVSTGKTLTINGAFEADLYRVFSGAGTVIFGDESIDHAHPEWWTYNTSPGATNMSVAINAAIQSTDAPIIITGENLVTPDLLVSGILLSNVNSCFNVKDNMHLKGTPGSSILKIADDVSTDTTPLLHYFFVSASANKDISFDGITFDFNGANNPISPDRPTSYNTYHQSAMYWGGTLGKVDNLTVNNCTFKTSPGTNTVCVAGPMSDNIKITNNYFIDNGWDTSDHTTVMLFAKNSEISGNVFTIPSLAIVIQNAIDVHGPYNIIRDNTVLDYVSAIGVTQNEDSGYDVHNVDVHDNVMSVYGIGVWLSRHSSGVKDYFNICVHNNVIEIVDSSKMTDAGKLGSYGIVIMPDLSISQIYINDNTISKIGGTTYPSYGIVVFNTASATISKLFIDGNNVDLFTQGISVPGFVSNGAITDIHVNKNIVTNCTASTIPALGAYGIILAVNTPKEITSAYILNNVLEGINSGDVGVFLGNTITTITYKNNHVKGFVDNYVESGLTNTNYYGDKTGTWIPVLEGTTGSAGSYAASAASGKWTRIEDLITANFTLALSNIGSWTGNVKITGLPFQATSEGYGSIYTGNVTFDGSLTPYLNSGEQFFGIAITKTGSAVTVLPLTGVANNSYFYGQITYRAAY